ncbi:hypothetical protein JCM10207_004990 [Rhodosporidiobolus poonsookiae]
MTARLASVNSSLSLLTCTLVAPCTLSLASDVHTALAPTFSELARIRRARQAGLLEQAGAVARLPDEVWEAIKAELRAVEYRERKDELVEPLRSCKWCSEAEERPEDEAPWKDWAAFAMRPTDTWDTVQESGYMCQPCGEYVQEVQEAAIARHCDALLDDYHLHAKMPAFLDNVTDETYLAVTHALPCPRVRFDLLPDPRRPRPSSTILQLDAARVTPPTESEVGRYGRFFREWPGVEVVRDPLHEARGLTGPEWTPRLTVWHEAEPELDED